MSKDASEFLRLNYNMPFDKKGVIDYVDVVDCMDAFSNINNKKLLDVIIDDLKHIKFCVEADTGSDYVSNHLEKYEKMKKIGT